MASLFTINTTRQDTQLAYKVRCFPWKVLSDSGKRLVAWRKCFFIRKDDLLQLLSEDLNTLTREGRQYKILWAYNCIPTEQEWNKKHDGVLLSVDLRVSPAIAEGAVAILEFNTPSGRHCQAELVSRQS